MPKIRKENLIGTEYAAASYSLRLRGKATKTLKEPEVEEYSYHDEASHSEQDEKGRRGLSDGSMLSLKLIEGMHASKRN
jgi:hypothetical protein